MMFFASTHMGISVLAFVIIYCKVCLSDNALQIGMNLMNEFFFLKS